MESITASSRERLTSWKEIAAYLDRGVRTVQRWEKEENLPVHRHTHNTGHFSVHAYRSELDEWLANHDIQANGKRNSSWTPKYVGLTCLAGVLAISLAGVFFWSRGLSSGPVTRLVATPAPTVRVSPRRPMADLAISPDGRHLVYVGEKAGVAQLYVRPQDDFESTAIPGTEGVESWPFFSPDSRWVVPSIGLLLQVRTTDGPLGLPMADRSRSRPPEITVADSIEKLRQGDSLPNSY